MKDSYVYIIANKPRRVLYTGVTSELIPRFYKHKLKLIPGFTARYNVCDLVYYEIHEDINVAIKREKTLKRWRKQWKFDLIEKDNPEWGCLYSSLLGQVS